MNYSLLLLIIALCAILSGCADEKSDSSVSTPNIEILVPSDTIETIPIDQQNELSQKFETDSIRSIEETRKDSLKKVLEAKQKESKNNSKSCEEIMKDYEAFLKKMANNPNNEKLNKELRTWIEDVPFQSCLKANPILNLIKDSLENEYL